MKLNYSIQECATLFQAEQIGNCNDFITHVYYDSRKIIHPNGALFFALSGEVRNGKNYIDDAYKKGIRLFVIDDKTFATQYDAVYFLVYNPLTSLQKLASYHRNKFTYPIVAITGSVGKTTFKEWLFHCISDRFRVVRSPKSYNSQLGVALSLLELNENASIALIEAGISKPGEMEVLKNMIRPDIGIFTAFGLAHRENFSDKAEHLVEKLKLFTNCKLVFVSHEFNEIEDRLPSNFQVCKAYEQHTHPLGFNNMLGVLASFLNYLQYSKEDIVQKLSTLPVLALRMEVFEGINNNLIINDTYNLDKNALNEALVFQQQLAKNKKRVVVIGLATKLFHEKSEIEQLISAFHPDSIFYINEGEEIPWNTLHDSVVLIKAHRARLFEHEVAKGRKLKHQTYVEIDLSAIKHNLQVYQQRLPHDVKILAMVKAASYGAGAETVALYLERNGVNNFGVAFADEGVALRNAGVHSTILVMNPDPEYSELIIENKLIPAVYSFEQLDTFVTSLIHRQINSYPIHLKFDTGMHRLGFDLSEKERLLSILNAQPEVKVTGIFSHLADADNEESSEFTQLQLKKFDEICAYFSENLPLPFTAHILNSEGALRYSESALNMVRIGISMYGYTENKKLLPLFKPSISWYSVVSQVKTVQAGEFVGYGCTFRAENTMQLAIVPVGYADGFRRNLSNGKGSVYIQGRKCLVVGRVCMDMIMVDVTGLTIAAGDTVEIIGKNQSMQAFANDAETIPYEIMTGLSKRMHRVYIEE